MILRGMLLTSFFFLSCADVTPETEEFPDREIIAYVCHNPNSVWHLSECGGSDQCLARDYDNDAYCHALMPIHCVNPHSSDFIRRACGFYYR